MALGTATKPGTQATPNASSPRPAANKTPAVVVPFTRAALRRSMLAFDTGNIALSAGAPATPAPIGITPAGFLRYVDLQFTLTTAGNAAATTFAADGPFNAVGLISVANAAGDTILSGVSGYQLYLINKYGALSEDPPNNDPRAASNGFSTTTGAGATGGSAAWTLRVPFELDPRDAFCAVPNSAANKQYQLTVQFAASAGIYGVAPTNPPTARIVGIAHYWSPPASAASPAGVSMSTEPLGNGSVSLHRIQTAPVTPGDRLVQLSGVGNVLRYAVFVLRTAAGARTAADLPGISQLLLNNDVWEYWPLAYWQNEMACAYGFVTGALDAANGLDSGVLVWFTPLSQRGRVMCDGPRSQWRPTQPATLLQFRGTNFGATANTLEVITNEIKPISASALYSANVE